MTTTATSQSSLGAFLEEAQSRSANSTEESQSSSFQAHMEEAAEAAEILVSGDATTLESPASSGESSISEPSSGQESQNGTVAQTISIASPASVTSAASASSATNPYATPLEDQSIAAVRQAMVDEGLDPDSVKMTYSSEFVWTPDGGRIDQLLTIETDIGRKLGFSAKLSLDNPQVTVCDVRHMLDGTGGWNELA